MAFLKSYKGMVLTSLMITILGFFGVLVLLYLLSKDLPSLEQLENYDPDLVTRIYSSDGMVLNELFVQKRVFIELEKIPSHMQNAIIAVSYTHLTLPTICSV